VIRVSSSDVTLLFKFQDPAMEIAGVPLANYDGVTHTASERLADEVQNSRKTRLKLESIGQAGSKTILKSIKSGEDVSAHTRKEKRRTN
jgi:hypothetical protein